MVPQYQWERNCRHRRRGDGKPDEVDTGYAVRIGGGLSEFELGDDRVVDQDGADRATGQLDRFRCLLDRICVGPTAQERIE